MYGAQLNDSLTSTACRVLDWQNAVVWIQPPLTAVNAGRAKVSHAGRQQTVFPKFCRQQAQILAILPNLLTRVIQLGNSRDIVKRKAQTVHMRGLFPWT